MIDKIEVRNVAGELLILKLDDISNGYLLADVEGLDPVKATIVTSSFAGKAGAQYQSSTRDERNIIFTIELLPDYVTQTVRGLRLALYNYFISDSQVSLRFFMDDGLTVDISGRVETCEAPLFTKEPSVKVSIICFDPDFVELSPETYSGNTVSDTTEFTIDYEGTSKVGILFTLNIDRTLSEFTIYHRPPDGITRVLDVQGSFVADDVVKISTVSGNKYASLTRDGSDSSALNSVSPQSTWIDLAPGVNSIRVYALGLGIPFTIEYTTRHGAL